MQRVIAAALVALLLVASPAQAGSWPWKWTISEKGRNSVVYASPKIARLTADVCFHFGLQTCVKLMRAPQLLADCKLQRVTAKKLARALRRAAAKGQTVYFMTEGGGYPWACTPAVGRLPV